VSGGRLRGGNFGTVVSIVLPAIDVVTLGHIGCATRLTAPSGNASSPPPRRRRSR